MKQQLDSTQLVVPHPSTLSRSRLLLDVLIMNWRKEQIRSSASGHFVFLSSDSSPQAGTDFLLTLEDRIERQYAGLVVDATDEEIASWNLSDYLKTSSLPVAVVGAGNSGVAGKYEGLLHSIVCDLGNQARRVAKPSRETSRRIVCVRPVLHLSSCAPIPIRPRLHSGLGSLTCSRDISGCSCRESAVLACCEAKAELIQQYTRDIVGYCSDYGAEWHFAQAGLSVIMN